MPRRRPLSPADAREQTVRTADGVDLSTYTLPAGRGAVPGLRIVAAHGFTNHSRRPELVRVLRRLTAYAEVTAFDFRGHGRSGGGSSAGGDGERADVQAVVDAVRADGARQVATVGFSMGAAAVLRQAADDDTPGRPDLVVAVSPVSRWYVRDTAAMRRVHWLLETRLGNAVAPVLLHTRLGPPWEVVPVPPVDVAHRIAPIPLLLVHGTRDRYFGPDHSRALRRAAGQQAVLWEVEGFDHAETAMSPQLATRIGRWIATTAQASGRVPAVSPSEPIDAPAGPTSASAADERRHVRSIVVAESA